MEGVFIFWGSVLLIVGCFVAWMFREELAEAGRPLRRRNHRRKIERLTAKSIDEMNRLIPREWQL